MKRDTQIGTCSANSSLDVTTTTQADGARAPSASLPQTGTRTNRQRHLGAFCSQRPIHCNIGM